MFTPLISPGEDRSCRSWVDILIGSSPCAFIFSETSERKRLAMTVYNMRTNLVESEFIIRYQCLNCLNCKQGRQSPSCVAQYLPKCTILLPTSSFHACRVTAPR